MFFLSLIFVLGLFYYLAKRHYDYWKTRNIPGPEPHFLVGNVGQNFLKKKAISEILTEIYRSYSEYPLVGIFNTVTPALLIRDPELIKDITVKSFKHFHDNATYVDVKTDPVIGRNPFFMKGESWKNTRQQLTPCFTSGKMKFVFPLIEKVCKRMIKYIEETKGPLESKELCTKFTLDSVASCAFGLDGQCFDIENSHFRKIATNFISPGNVESIKILLSFLIPQSISKFFKVKLLKKEVEDELGQIVKDTLEYREKNGVVRNDFLHIMNEIRNAHPEEFTYEDVTAHAASFFGDGFETSSIVMSFILYELACNQEAQDMLRVEIKDSIEANKGLTYEGLQQMEYLDACFFESMRKNPPVGLLLKKCTSDYNYVTDDSRPYKKLKLTIEKDTTIVIPLDGLHNDPQYYPEPEKYQPERFMGENKKSLNKNPFLPFGDGPRACLGQRFGILQIKIAVAYIIDNFYITPNSKTKTPLKYDNWYFMLSPIGGLWLDFKKIN